MIRNAIQVFWTKPYLKKENNSFGFKSLRHFYMSAFYSLKCLKDNGYTVTLITDDYGKELLSNYLKLEYDKIDLSLNNLQTSPHLWGLSKVYAYSIQTKPFIYIDLDAFMIQELPKECHNAAIICQNIEVEYPCYYSGYLSFDKFINYKDKIYKYVEDGFKNSDAGNSYNTAIFGGNDLVTIHKYCNEVFEFAEKNYLTDLICEQKEDKETMTILSVFLEQVYLYYYLNLFHPDVKVVPYLESNIDSDLSYFKNWNNKYVHLIFILKRESGIMLDKLEEETIKHKYLELEEDYFGFGYEKLIELSKINY